MHKRKLDQFLNQAECIQDSRWSRDHPDGVLSIYISWYGNEELLWLIMTHRLLQAVGGGGQGTKSEQHKPEHAPIW